MLNTVVNVVDSSADTVRGGRMTKVDRYHWASRNQKGELAYVNKASIAIDRTYQRDLNDQKRLRIASGFNWAAFGALTLARRRDGTLWCVDGQHRLQAAMSRSDVQDVPCVIFDLGGEHRDEATDFLMTNKERKPLTGLESFRAMLASGDIHASDIVLLCQSIGRTIGKASPTTVACPVAIRACLVTDREAVWRIWPLIGVLTEGTAIDNRLVQAMCYLERKLMTADGAWISVARTSKLTQRLKDAGLDEINKAMFEAAVFYKTGSAGVWARGIVNILNYRCQRKYSLTVNTESDK